MFDDDATNGEYVTEAEGRGLFPGGVAEWVECRLCGVTLLLPPGDAAICTLHRN